VVADAVPLRQRRRRRWAGAAAAAVAALGVVAGALRLRDFIWGEQLVAELDSEREPAAYEQPGEVLALAEPEAAASLATAEIEPPRDDAVSTSPPTRATEGKTLPPYLQSLSRQSANDQGQEPANGAEEPDGTTQTETQATPERVATIQSAADSSEAPLKAGRKRAKLPSNLQRSLSLQARHRTSAAQHVGAHLMGEATSARAVDRLCQGDGTGTQGCSETEKDFMKDTVVGLPSGVKYKVITNGTGRSPGAGDTVLVSYRGLLPDGTEFDSGGPGVEEAFRLSQAIPGLQDVLPYMEEGAKWEVYVPTELAFPEPGPLGGQEVIFTIELLAVEDSEVPAVATEEIGDKKAARASAPGADESYWQVATGGEADEPEAGQALALETRRLLPFERRAATEQFLAENAEHEGVISLPSGLQYRVLKDGSGGRSPTATDTVTLNYRGMFTDGREFDRSEGATEFSLEEVIPGWQEALQHMEEGSQWEVVIPPSLAHRGAVRRRGTFGQQPLIYQIELVSINESGATVQDR
jgi:FKBP-type peptidyl-prolyl cis-trans isomerase